jgi:hypothetical protein
VAEKISDFTIQKTRTSRYPWEEWTDGSIWRIKQGEDFDTKVVSMVGTLYSKAKSRGLKVVLAYKDDAVEFQFTKPVKPNAVRAVAD